MSEFEIGETRQRSLKIVQMIFAAMAFVCVIMALLFRAGDVGAALPEAERLVIANSFLAVAALDTLMLFVWERLFTLTSPEDQSSP